MIENHGVDPYWMPFLTGLLFVVPLLVSVFLLAKIPPPRPQDEALRSQRLPMNREDRRAFVRKHRFSLLGLLAIYMLLTIMRSIRDDFAVEIWRDLGVGKKPEVFTQSEFLVMVGVVVINGLASLIRNSRTALLASMAMVCASFLVVIASVVAFRSGHLSPMTFMVLLGLGMYVPYVAFHTTVFERLIAAYRDLGTIAFLMCLADAMGYLVYVPIMLSRQWISDKLNFLNLMNWASVIVSVISMAIAVFLLVYFYRTVPQQTLTETDSP